MSAVSGVGGVSVWGYQYGRRSAYVDAWAVTQSGGSFICILCECVRISIMLFLAICVLVFKALWRSDGMAEG